MQRFSSASGMTTLDERGGQERSPAHGTRFQLRVKTMNIPIIDPINNWMLTAVATRSIGLKLNRLVEEIGSER